jgi:hypothetical protein
MDSLDMLKDALNVTLYVINVQDPNQVNANPVQERTSCITKILV